MNNCKDCKYWDRDGIEDISNDNMENIKLCTKTIFLQEAKEFVRNGTDVTCVLSEKYKDQKMFTIDGSGYRADFYSREDFYCNHFKEKE